MRFYLGRFVKYVLILCAAAAVFLLNMIITITVVQYKKHGYVKMGSGIPEISYDISGYRESKTDSFNIYMASTSDKTRHEWSWPETKDNLKKCDKRNYLELGPLPSVSVIITFISKENISTILHTVHSIAQRTPPEVLKEIILIDDNSDKDDHDETLAIYTKAVFGDLVRICRFNRTIGLIKGRLTGFRLARAEVVVSMDSHMEVQPRWIEPLLYEIQKNPKTLAASSLDWMSPIKDENYRWSYKHGGWYWKTYFDWTLVFGYQAVSKHEEQTLGDVTQPLKSPVTIGTIFAINKKFFDEIGEFDEGMELWGGENLDLPIRAWMCGGRVINCPCSRAAHLEYSGSRDYRKNWDRVIERNYKRFISVWMPEYLQYFYQYYPELKEAKEGDVSSRMDITKKCRPDFKWYFTDVFPELGMPFDDSFGYGGIKNKKHGTCVDTRYTLNPQLEPCNNLRTRQQGFYWSKDLRIRMPMHVFNIQSRGSTFAFEQDEITSQFYGHPDLTTWIHWKDGPLYAKEKDMCLEASSSNILTVAKCDTDKLSQLWSFIKYTSAHEELISGKGYSEQCELIDVYKKKLKPG